MDYARNRDSCGCRHRANGHFPSGSCVCENWCRQVIQQLVPWRGPIPSPVATGTSPDVLVDTLTSGWPPPTIGASPHPSTNWGKSLSTSAGGRDSGPSRTPSDGTWDWAALALLHVSIWPPLFGLTPPPSRRTDYLYKIFIERSHMAKVPNGMKTLAQISIAWVGCTNVTDDRRTGDDIQRTWTWVR